MHMASPIFVLTPGLTALMFNAEMLTVNRGTYSAAICVSPGMGNHFVGDSTYTIATTTFSTYPTTFYAY